VRKRERDLTNIPEGTTVCSVCRQRKDNLEFSWYTSRPQMRGPNKTSRTRPNSHCRDCRKFLAKQLKKAKDWAIKNGFPRPEYGEPCQCCGKPVYKCLDDIPDGVIGRWSWQCDHDHETGKFRGWVCKSCNTGFGGLGDNIESLSNALEYLRKTQ
jgi:hypothetical protein